MKCIVYILLFTIGLISCSKDQISQVDSVNFVVSANKQSLKVGDTVNFTFEGNPDFITFYSGEVGHKYANINRLIVDGGKPTLSFTTYASTVGTQNNSLKILASTDFKGVYDTLNQNLLGATWVDLTSRAVLSSGADSTKSGVIDISDINPDKKTIWFAFKKYDENSSTLKPWAWKIETFNVNLYSPSDSANYAITDFANAGWYATDISNASYSWTISGTSMAIGGGGLNTSTNEDWVVTKGLNTYGVAPDIGIPVKSIDARVSSYAYVFATPGTYTISFLAINQNVNERRELVRELNITVLP